MATRAKRDGTHTSRRAPMARQRFSLFVAIGSGERLSPSRGRPAGRPHRSRIDCPELIRRENRTYGVRVRFIQGRVGRTRTCYSANGHVARIFILLA